MKRLLNAVIALLVLVLLAGAGAIWYVWPTESLDFQHEEVPLQDRAIDMALALSPDLELTAEDVNNLAKASLSQKKQYQPDVELTGANFHFSRDRLIADVNIKWKGILPVGLTLTYRLDWQAPNLVATVEEAKIRGISLNTDWFEPVYMPIGEQLPRIIKVDQVRVSDGKLIATLRLPNVDDLKALLR
ncbi:hypothetical protein [Paenibacillus sp. GCM10027626]|uniref:hypothetical protein n=1 Tax=Paenibacillus sp. GCM10027626 TaxID=3273411 RepID=UPI00363B06B4